MTDGFPPDDHVCKADNLLFVYGTLKKGECREQILASQNFLKNVSTAKRYTLFSVGSYPGLVEGGETAIPGELWAVDDRCMERLDMIEGVSFGLFRRGKVALEGGGVATTYFYGQSTSGLEEIEAWPVVPTCQVP